MPSWDLVVVVADRVPTLVMEMGGTGWCAVPTRRSGLVCGGVVGLPCCRSGCVHSFASLLLCVCWDDHPNLSGVRGGVR